VIVQDSTESEVFQWDTGYVFSMGRTHVVKGSLKFVFDSR
jgi:hypothetical protein